MSTPGIGCRCSRGPLIQFALDIFPIEKIEAYSEKLLTIFKVPASGLRLGCCPSQRNGFPTRTVGRSEE